MHGISNIINWEHNIQAQGLAMHVTPMPVVGHADVLMQGYRFSSKPVQAHSMTTFIPLGVQRQWQAARLGPTQIIANGY